jgi:ATP-dependent DNA helicase RecG
MNVIVNNAILFYREKGETTSSEYAERYKVSDRTARRDLSELIDIKLLNNEGDTNLSKYIFI